ncbi:hypothetical protein BC940DRAFT_11865 [Gongronella butleri]|nr:hypothetical protein BC940DRAFT_11865 [Gongronella butleri]
MSHPTSLSTGLSLGVFGMIGLMLSLLSLLPINVYNIYLASHTALTLVQLEQGNPWWRFSHARHYYYFAFLVGSAVSSLIVFAMVITTCLRRKQPVASVDLEANAAAWYSQHALLQQQQQRYQHTSVWTNRWACVAFLVQISWAVFGNHLIWFVKTENTLISDATRLSVWILWLNYGIVIVFSFVLVCASVFVLVGAPNHLSATQPPAGPHLGPMVTEEMQQQETTPLLNKTASSATTTATSTISTTTSSRH